MTLDENQKRQVARWLDEGLKLAEVQKRLEQELGLRLTYMEVKFLVSDLNLKPKDPEPEKPATPPPGTSAAPHPSAATDDFDFDEEPAGGLPDEGELPPAGAGGVQVAVDQIARPGAMISGRVTFANGKTNEWILDQLGRLGVVPAADGYKPTAAELRDFQVALQGELQKLGF